LDITLETQKFRVRNPLNQELHFCIENTLKLAYKHLEVKKISGGFAPCTPRKGRERGRVGRGGENRRGEGTGREGAGGGKGKGRQGKGRRGKGREGEGKERGPPSKNSLKKALIYFESYTDSITKCHEY
jgi:hypothetical protein